MYAGDGGFLDYLSVKLAMEGEVINDVFSTEKSDIITKIKQEAGICESIVITISGVL